jgi:5,10-methenyltetrahydrofolate synthetase
MDKQTKTLTFHSWYPGCVMEEDAYNIPKPKDTEIIQPTLLFVPCVGYGPGGYRLGYGGGFYDRSVALLRRESAVLAIGIGYAAQEMAELPTGRTDAKLDWVVSESEAIKC